MFGICNLSVVPCRKSASDRSEMVTQLLFGETFEILFEQKKWIKIKNHFDGYISWIDKKQYEPLPQKIFSKLTKEAACLAGELIHPLSNVTDEKIFPIVLGSTLPALRNNKFELLKSKFIYEGQVIKPAVKKHTRTSILEYAYLYLNT